MTIELVAMLRPASEFSICDYDTVAQIEPAVLCIYHLPVGSDLVFVDDGSRRFYDTKTGKEADSE